METKPRKSATVLLVEDEDLVRKTAHRILTQAGYSVIQASHGAQALDIAANGGEAIDLLLTDVVMPRMNGVEVAAGLSSIYPDVKVLYMSGYTEDAISSHGVLDPGVRIVFKPFTKGSLLNSVSEALSG
jgi:CheY-like chemotaxis protein